MKTLRKGFFGSTIILRPVHHASGRLCITDSSSNRSRQPRLRTLPRPRSLVIGEIETLTGASSDNLKLAASGAYLAQQYVNNHGGITINGETYMVDIKLEDNKGTADGASAAATKLIQDEGVRFRHRQWSPTPDRRHRAGS